MRGDHETDHGQYQLQVGTNLSLSQHITNRTAKSNGPSPAPLSPLSQIYKFPAPTRLQPMPWSPREFTQGMKHQPFQTQAHVGTLTVGWWTFSGCILTKLV